MRTNRLHALAFLLLSAALASCATGGAGGARSSSSALTAEDFETYAGQDLYTIVQRLRPQWLQVRGATTAQGRASISIIIDGVVQPGGVELLRNLRGTDVQEVRHLSASDATTRYGTNMDGGAIVIDLRR